MVLIVTHVQWKPPVWSYVKPNYHRILLFRPTDRTDGVDSAMRHRRCSIISRHLHINHLNHIRFKQPWLKRMASNRISVQFTGGNSALVCTIPEKYVISTFNPIFHTRISALANRACHQHLEQACHRRTRIVNHLLTR